MTNPADIPPPLPWELRAKAVGSMPGGNASYLETLREVCGFVSRQRPTSQDLVGWLQNRFGLKENSASWRGRFLQNTGILEFDSGLLQLSKFADRWYESEDDGIVIALLHSRLQFIGEMLAELSARPLRTEELRLAADRYGLNWERGDQIARRRRWLQSAKLTEPAGSGRIAITDAGRDLLSKLDLYVPSGITARPQPSSATNSQKTGPEVDNPDSPLTDAPKPDLHTPTIDLSDAKSLANRIRDASTDSKNPDRLEIAVRDAFDFLGFDAEKLGGSGKTDVLVKAPLGKEDSYTVTIDAKTVGSGSLGDHQVDWVTLEDHRKQHNADYSMLVGPNPSGQRLMSRAINKSVAVLSTEQLAELCIQHADAPLGLQDYRALFESGGAVDTVSIGKAAQDLTRLRDLAVEICSKLAERTGAFGPLTAPQLMVMLGQPDKSSSEQEIQQVLDTLASPLIGAVQGKASEGYVLATAPRVIQQRLQLLGDQLAR